MLYLANEKYSRFYHAQTFSFASFLCIFITVGLVIITAFLTFATSGIFPSQYPPHFWHFKEVGLRQLVYAEQPKIVFRNELLMYNFQDNQLFAYSSVSSFNNRFENLIVSPTIKVKKKGNNFLINLPNLKGNNQWWE